MSRILFSTTIIALGVMTGVLSARSQDRPEDFSAWPELVNPFESTSGGGVMIDGYKPIVDGVLCRTDFSVKLPDQDKASIFSVVEFDAKPMQGGVLCENGRWRTKDGSAQGTTPFRVFLKDGVTRRPPAG